MVRGFTFWASRSFEENVNKIVGRFEEVMIEEEDITLVLEFDPSVFASNAHKLVRIIKEINHPGVNALWDPGHDIYVPEGEISYPNGYEIINLYGTYAF